MREWSERGGSIQCDSLRRVAAGVYLASLPRECLQLFVL